MIAMTRILFALALTTSAVTGCSKKDGDGSAQSADVAWPAKPADGTPLVLDFIKLEGTGDDAKAVLRVFNFTDKGVKAAQMRLHYLDAAGKELKTFPWGAAAPQLVGAKGVSSIKAGAFLPPETKSVKVTLRAVDFADGSEWERAGDE